MLCSLSHLDQSGLKAIQNLEKEIGKPLLSFSCQDIKAADVNADVLAKIKKLEEELHIALVAVEN